MAHCDNCGEDNASLVSAGYSTPLPDVAPTYSEWEELWLCESCAEDSFPQDKEK